MKIKNILPVLLLGISLAACDDEEINSGETGSLVIEFDNRAGDSDLQLDHDYMNANGETFKLTKLNYYISNIRLTKTDGTVFTIPQDSSYFLVTEDNEASQHVRLNNIPAGNYDKISFMIGVDSLRSTTDVSKRFGVLDPAQGHDGMYWTWNSGYIFLKMEGISPAAPADQEHKFYYHIGGYGGYDSPTLNNIRETTVSMENARAEVRAGKVPQVHLHVDVQEFFENPAPIRIAEHSLVMFSDFSLTVSANYVNMFKYNHVHN